MKVKVFGLVLVLHVAVLGLLLQPGCNTVSKNTTAHKSAPIGNDEYSGLWEMSDMNISSTKSKADRIAEFKTKKTDRVSRTVAYQETVKEEIIDLNDSKIETASVYTDRNQHMEYTVAKGDNLWKIANENHVSMKKLMDYNGLKKSDYLRPGQVLMIPGAASSFTKNVVAETKVEAPQKEKVEVRKLVAKKAEPKKTVVAVKQPVKAEKKETVSIEEFNTAFNDIETASVSAPVPTSGLEEGIYEVQAGDSLYIIAMQYNTTVDNIRRINKLDRNLIKVGQKIRIPGQYKGPIDFPTEQAKPAVIIAKAPEQTDSGDYLTHVVKSGEFPGLIARKYNMNVADLLHLNDIRNPRAMKVGTTLKVINPEQMLNKTQVALDDTSVNPEAVAVRMEDSESKMEEETSVNTINFDDFPVVRVGS